MTEATTVDTSFTSRELPWIKLGRLSDTGLSVQDAIKEGGLDFTVSLRDVKYEVKVNDKTTDEPQWERADKRAALVSDDSDELFEVVSAKKYKIIQYAEAMDFIGTVNPTVVAAGTMRNRKQGFMVVQLPGLSSVQALQDVDPHDMFCVLRTSHDRTRALEIALMPLRGKCMNMLPLASMTQGAKQRWAISHQGNPQAKIAEAQFAIKRTEAYAIGYADTVQRLIATPMDVEAGEKILRTVIRKSPRSEDTVHAVTALWQNDQTVGFTDSAWGLVNAVSSYYQWERKAAGTTATSQFTGALSGGTYSAINRTLVRALRAA